MPYRPSFTYFRRPGPTTSLQKPRQDSADLLILFAAAIPLLLVGALMLVFGVEAGRAAAQRRTKIKGVSSAAAGWSAAAAPEPPATYEEGWGATSRRATELKRQTTSERRTTFQMPIRDSCAHFGPKRAPSERRTDMARPLERKTTAMALREGKGRAMSDNI